MNRVAAEVDIRYALRKYYTERIVYPRTLGWAQAPTITVSGTIGAIPYGDYYKKGDVFTDPVGDGLLGKIYYVVDSQEGSPTLVLQQESATGNAHPRVVLVDHLDRPEVTQGDSRVYVGIRSRPTARAGFVRALHVGRVLHDTEPYVVLTEPFWRGGISLYVEGTDKLETGYVFEMLNTRIQTRTDIYKFDIDVKPLRAEVVGLEASGVFRYVLVADVAASASSATPVTQLPDGMPTVYFPYDPILGVSPVIEDWGDDGFPRYAEKVGNFPLTDDPVYVAESDIPPTE